MQVQKTIPGRRQIWPFGSRLGLSEISYWQACHRISFKTISRIFFRFRPQCSPQCLVVQVPKTIRSVEKHGRRRPSLIFLITASPQKLRITYVKNSFEFFTEVNDSHVFVTSVKHSHEFFTGVTNTFEFLTLVTVSFDFHIRTNLSHVLRICSYLSHM